MRNSGRFIVVAAAIAGLALALMILRNPQDEGGRPPLPAPSEPFRPVPIPLPETVPDLPPIPQPLAIPEPPVIPPPPARIYTLQERIDEIGPAARARLKDRFQSANVRWPPAEATLIALKDQNILELYARSFGRRWTLIHRYPVLRASGVAGPKLRYGDLQVPEGIYKIEYLNPNSRFHVSLKLDYPNAFDRAMGVKDGRIDLGGDIMIHGKAASVGCLAMGDEASEELFVLTEAISIRNVTAIIAPTDFRRTPYAPPKPIVRPVTTQAAGASASAASAKTASANTPGTSPPWLPDLYADIDRALKPFRPN
jgi:hypothetical protein